MGRTTDNYHQIEKVIADYVEGGNGNAELLRSVFLPTAIINGSPIEELYRIVRERGETHSTGRIDMLDIQERRCEREGNHRGLARNQLRGVLPPHKDT